MSKENFDRDFEMMQLGAEAQKDMLRLEISDLKEMLLKTTEALEQAVKQLETDYIYAFPDGRGALILKLKSAIAKSRDYD